MEQAKEPNEIALASPVSTDQDIQRAEFKVLQLPDRLESLNRQLLDRVAHRRPPSA